MKYLLMTTLLLLTLFLSACGTLDKKTILINAGDSKQEVISIMDVPDDRQFRQASEAWQYCVSGAGFGWNDHKIIWFTHGKVTGITTYRTRNGNCSAHVKSVRWEEAPDYILDIRRR